MKAHKFLRVRDYEIIGGNTKTAHVSANDTFSLWVMSQIQHVSMCATLQNVPLAQQIIGSHLAKP